MFRLTDRAARLRAVAVALAGLSVPVLALSPAAAADSGGSGGEVRKITAVVLDIGGEVESLDGVTAERTTTTTETVILTSDVLFAVGSADLSAEARTALGKVATTLLDGGVSGEVRVDGYTDDQGGDAFNLDLSQRRAASVAAVLGPLLTGASVHLVPQGYGETKPRAANQDADGKPIPENQKRNRRVEVTTTPTKP